MATSDVGGEAPSGNSHTGGMGHIMRPASSSCSGVEDGCLRSLSKVRAIVHALSATGMVVAWATATLVPTGTLVAAARPAASDHWQGDQWTDLLANSPVRARFALSTRESLEYRGPDGSVVTAEDVGAFLSARRSPLAPFSRQVISASNAHDVDPRLIVAIAGVESNFGRVCKGFNAWGWNNGRTRWRSWPESIDGFAERVSVLYPNRSNLRRMAGIYNPVTPDAWGRKVARLIESLQRVATV